MSNQIPSSKLEIRKHAKCAIRISNWFRFSSFALRILLLGLICLSCPGQTAPAQSSNLKRDQDVVLFPTLARRSASNSWDLNIHGCVYEPDQRTVVLTLIRAALGLEHVSLTTAENKLFSERARLFMVDHKAGRKIVVRIGDAEFTLPKSAADGHFST